MNKVLRFFKLSYKELIYQVVLIVVLFIYFSYHQDETESVSIYSLFLSYKFAFFGNYIVCSIIINYFLLPKFYYKKQSVLFFTITSLLILAVILIDEFILEKIFFPDTRGRYFPGVLFVGIMCLVDYLLSGEFQSLNSYLFQGIFFGIFVGIGFPYITQKFGTKFTSKIGKNIKPELSQEENIEIEGPANLFRGIEGVGGKMFLTNEKVIFKSHKINIQKGQTDILYENITEIIKRKTAKLIDNGIRIKTNDGNEFDFVVNEREKWIENLNEKITHYNTVYN